jgi:4-hydroxy-4-methyl-2-oxoglutarate aldolase
MGISIETLCKSYSDLYAGVIQDSLQFDFGINNPSFRIPYYSSKKTVCGKAFPCFGSDIENVNLYNDFTRIEMLNSMNSPSIQVISTNSDKKLAHYGDISALLASRNGAVGCLIDGYTRDLDIINNKTNMVIGSLGTHPADAYGKWGIVNFGLKVNLNREGEQISISPGDLVHMSIDGGVIIPFEIAEDVLKLAQIRKSKEDVLRTRLIHEDPEKLYEEIGRW